MESYQEQSQLTESLPMLDGRGLTDVNQAEEGDVQWGSHDTPSDSSDSSDSLHVVGPSGNPATMTPSTITGYPDRPFLSSGLTRGTDDRAIRRQAAETATSVELTPSLEDPPNLAGRLTPGMMADDEASDDDALSEDYFPPPGLPPVNTPNGRSQETNSGSSSEGETSLQVWIGPGGRTLAPNEDFDDSESPETHSLSSPLDHPLTVETTAPGPHVEDHERQLSWYDRLMSSLGSWQRQVESYFTPMTDEQLEDSMVLGFHKSIRDLFDGDIENNDAFRIAAVIVTGHPNGFNSSESFQHETFAILDRAVYLATLKRRGDLSDEQRGWIREVESYYHSVMPIEAKVRALFTGVEAVLSLAGVESHRIVPYLSIIRNRHSRRARESETTSRTSNELR